ncbi:MAG: ribosomal protein S18-alanine N-acetyltransferase [Elusimicrobia bacterium]|nr:ribosomal protein S18-alanine N-acetyltransferase [Elusimicrobiota bacterium]
MSVRPAAPADLGAVRAAAEACAFSARWSREDYGRELARAESWLLVWDEGGIKGFILCRRVLDEAQILDVAVRPPDRGRGIATALLEALARRARQAGCAKLSLEVDERNLAALALYRKAGYGVVGRRRKFYNNAFDAVLMDRPLG